MGVLRASQGGTGQVGTGQIGTGQVNTSRFHYIGITSIQVRTGQVKTSQAGQNVQVLLGTRVWPYSVLLVSPLFCLYFDFHFHFLLYRS